LEGGSRRKRTINNLGTRIGGNYSNNKRRSIQDTTSGNRTID